MYIATPGALLRKTTILLDFSLCTVALMIVAEGYSDHFGDIWLETARTFELCIVMSLFPLENAGPYVGYITGTKKFNLSVPTTWRKPTTSLSRSTRIARAQRGIDTMLSKGQFGGWQAGMFGVRLPMRIISLQRRGIRVRLQVH
ncbi:hypothetical protein BDQ17DRAFT_138927 [Cyathus striatus]|nr:hypothetical protein BDQ17DRAFT_138927 [Cyathus striatus]